MSPTVTGDDDDAITSRLTVIDHAICSLNGVRVACSGLVGNEALSQELAVMTLAAIFLVVTVEG